MSNSVDLIIVGIYLAAMLGIGFLVSKYIRSFNDYFIAGRVMTVPLLVCTLVSTYYGLDVTFGASEVGFYEGVVEWFVASRPYYIAIFIGALFLTTQVKKYEGHSLPAIMGNFYGKGAQVASAIGSFVYAIPIMAMMAFGVLFSKFFGMSYIAGVLLGAVLSISYTLMGGFWADVLTDSVQFAIMCVSLAVAIPFALHMIGGVDALFSGAPQTFWNRTGDSDAFWYYVALGATALSVLVEPAFYHRVFASKGAKEVRNALIMGILIWAAYDWAVTLLGIVAKVAVDKGILGETLQGREALISILLIALPVGLKGIFMAGILSAAMSTVDSYLLVSSGGFVMDILSNFRKKPFTDAQLLKLTRWGVVIATLPCVIVAIYFERISAAWLFMSAMLTSSLLIPLILGLYFPNLRRPRAGFLSSCFGLLTVILFYSVVYGIGVYDEAYESYALTLPAFSTVWTIRAEYTLFFSLPMSAVGFILGYMFTHSQERPYGHNRTQSV